MFLSSGLCFVGLACAGVSAGGGDAKPAVETAGRFVAIDNVCAWPNLTKLADGTVVATVFNQPSHGRLPGDVACYASQDGRFWEPRGIAAPHEEGGNRMNVAAGAASNGDLIVLSSGWSFAPEGKYKLDKILHPWVCRSADGGQTWAVARTGAFPPAPEGFTELIPFGDVLAGADGSLRAACYARDEAAKKYHVWMLRSADDGKTWSVLSKVAPSGRETALLHLGGGRWLAAARANGDEKQRLNLLRSEDDGKTWGDPEPLTESMHHPAHLLRLRDGRVLLTYGVRTPGRYGVSVKWSADDGRTWGPEQPLVGDLVNGDCGYPATVELKGGTLLTAYYASGVAAHRRYHMGTLLWKAPARTQP